MNSIFVDLKSIFKIDFISSLGAVPRWERDGPNVYHSGLKLLFNGAVRLNTPGFLLSWVK